MNKSLLTILICTFTQTYTAQEQQLALIPLITSDRQQRKVKMGVFPTIDNCAEDFGDDDAEPIPMPGVMADEFDNAKKIQEGDASAVITVGALGALNWLGHPQALVATYITWLNREGNRIKSLHNDLPGEISLKQMGMNPDECPDDMCEYDLNLTEDDLERIENQEQRGLCLRKRLGARFDTFKDREECSLVFECLSSLCCLGAMVDKKILTKLHLISNELTVLDKDTFSGLIALQDLSLGCNQLIALDKDTFSGLTALQKLCLWSNELTVWDKDVFSGLTVLDTLDIGNNKLTTLDSNIFTGLTSLQHLDLHNNQLTTLDLKLFTGLTALQNLQFYNNKLTTLDTNIFAGLTALQYLYLHKNQLTTLDPKLLTELTALQDLYLSDNKLTEINPKMFSGLVALQELDLEKNKLTRENVRSIRVEIPKVCIWI